MTRTKFLITATLLSFGSLVSSNINIVFYKEAGCKGAAHGSCAFDDPTECCMWNTYVGSVAYSGDNYNFGIAFDIGSSECVFGGDGKFFKWPQGGSGCLDIGTSSGNAALVCEICNVSDPIEWEGDDGE